LRSSCMRSATSKSNNLIQRNEKAKNISIMTCIFNWYRMLNPIISWWVTFFSLIDINRIEYIQIQFIKYFIKTTLTVYLIFKSTAKLEKEMSSIFLLWTFYLYVVIFQQQTHIGYISLSWYDIPELVVFVMISLIEGFC
jgi:hypothetical protein